MPCSKCAERDKECTYIRNTVVSREGSASFDMQDFQPDSSVFTTGSCIQDTDDTILPHIDADIDTLTMPLSTHCLQPPSEQWNVGELSCLVGDIDNMSVTIPEDDRMSTNIEQNPYSTSHLR